jgi:hypothetical protein
LEPASQLFIKYFKEAREKLNILTQRYENRENILPLLQDIYKKSLGVVAVDNGVLIGYLIGIPISKF